MAAHRIDAQDFTATVHNRGEQEEASSNIKALAVMN